MSKRQKSSRVERQKSLHDYSRELGGDDHKFDEEKAYRALAMFTSHCEVPPTSYMTDSFKDLIRALNPQFHVKFDSIERHCLDVYKEEKILIKQILEKFDGQISLSLDVMRHDGTHGREIHFVMCLRAHFIDSNWNYKDWVISYFEPKYVHLDYANACNKTYVKALLDFHLCNKISTLTLGNVDDNDNAIEFIEERIERKIHLKDLIFRVHCCADTFRHMVEYAFEQIENDIGTVRLLVSFGKSPPMWHIIIDDLQKAIEMESKGEYTNTDIYDFRDLPSDSKWKKIKVVTKLVGFIYNAAEPLFETKIPTASMYLQNIWELLINLRKDAISSDEFMNVTATELLKMLDRYWKDMSLFLAVVTVMDPRCKMKYVEFFSCENKNNDGNLRVAQVLKTIEGLFKSYLASDLEAANIRRDIRTPDTNTDNSDSEDDYPLPEDVEQRRGNPSFGFSCLDKYNQFIESNNRPLKSELELYLEAPVVHWEKDFNILSWWRIESPKYPTLAKIARDLLAIPLTLATEEDAYYMEFRPPDKSLISLKPDLVNALKCTRSWYKEPKKEKI